jgi:O-antigen/teichoic acid export membrane protein
VARTAKLIGRARESVPEGTFAVGAGLLIASVTSYIFLVLALNSLDESGKAGFGAFWGLIFVAGPGFFLPLEQEVGRSIAHRAAQGIGGAPLVHKAARLGGLLTAVLVVAALGFSGVLTDKMFHGEELLVVALALGLVGFFVMHTARGTLSGNGRFRPYGEMLAIEGIVRLVGAIVLAVLGVDDAGAYGLCLAIAPFVAVLLALRNQRGLLRPGPDAPYSELSNALGFLLGGSVLMQLLGYSPLLAVNLLETSTDKTAAATFTTAFVMARIPILLFQAVQGTLLPRLANLAGAGRHDDFRAGLKRLMILVLGVAALGSLLAFTLGPPVGEILFEDFAIGNTDLGLLATGSGAFIVALTIAQALIALEGHARQTVSWFVGILVFGVVVAVVSDLFLRVELAFLLGSIAAALMMLFFLVRDLRSGRHGELSDLVRGIETEPLEL